MLTQRPFCVGLTGGIGSGKTTVANLFAKLGVPIIDADEIAHRLTRPNTAIYRQILTHFGDGILNDDKTLDRKKLREIVFNNAAEKKWLENVLHPVIRQTLYSRIQHAGYPYCICVIPLLAEAKEMDFIDRVLVVDAPVAIQRLRAQHRDQVSPKDIQKIIDAQSDRMSRLKIADDVILNDHDIPSLENKVLSLHQSYLSVTHT